MLQSLLVVNGKIGPLMKRQNRDSTKKWDAFLYRHGLEGDSQLEAMLDKKIFAMSSVLIGASGSTFTLQNLHPLLKSSIASPLRYGIPGRNEREEFMGMADKSNSASRHI